MLAIGVELRVEQFRALLSNPRPVVLGTIIHSLTFPSLAIVAVVALFLLDVSLAEATVLGVLLVAACPSGGFSNILTSMARANLTLSVVLTAISSLLSFATVPLLLSSFGFFVTELSTSIELPVTQILLQLTVLILFPLLVGMLLAKRFIWITPTRVSVLQKYTQLILYITVALMIVESWQIMVAGFVQALPWSIGLCAGNIIICYWLARKAKFTNEDAITVCLEGSIRNLGVAFLIAANTLERVDIAVLPTVYFLTVLVISILFAKNWQKLPGFN